MARVLPCLTLCAGLVACGDDLGGAARSVPLGGVTFAFAGRTLLSGVRVGIAEHPELETVSDLDGGWTLEVPDGEPATPFAELERYPRMYLETFTPSGAGLERVNFQLVNQSIYRTFAAIVGEDPDPGKCQIATTVNVAAIGTSSFEELVAYGPHGVAGATVETEPPMGVDTVYFTSSTLPDRTLTETTDDGGVVWANVPPGVYTLRATHPERAFRECVVTCEPGRFINAGPPWGLHEL